MGRRCLKIIVGDTIINRNIQTYKHYALTPRDSENNGKTDYGNELRIIGVRMGAEDL